MLKKKIIALAGVVVLAVGASACSSDDSKSLKSGDSTETTKKSTKNTTEDTTENSTEITKRSTTQGSTETTKKGSTVITLPDISMPDFSIPDFSIPDFSIPDFSIPDFSMPTGITIPDFNKNSLAELIVMMSGNTLEQGCVENLLDDQDIFDKVMNEGESQEVIDIFMKCKK